MAELVGGGGGGTRPPRTPGTDRLEALGAPNLGNWAGTPWEFPASGPIPAHWALAHVISRRPHAIWRYRGQFPVGASRGFGVRGIFAMGGFSGVYPAAACAALRWSSSRIALHGDPPGDRRGLYWEFPA